STQPASCFIPRLPGQRKRALPACAESFYIEGQGVPGSIIEIDKATHLDHEATTRDGSGHLRRGETIVYRHRELRGTQSTRAPSPRNCAPGTSLALRVH